MIHTIVVPNNQTVSFNIPQKYIGKELEVIIFEKEEEMKKNDFPEKTKTFSELSVSEKSLAKDWLSDEDKRWDNLL